jgi:hypothetical protein
MNAASGTSLVLSVLSLVVSLVVGVGALLMARANLQRQIQVTAREAWMREFREKVSAFLTWEYEVHRLRQNIADTHKKVEQALARDEPHDPNSETIISEFAKRNREVHEKLILASHTIDLLYAERGWGETDFTRHMKELLALEHPVGAEKFGSLSGQVEQAAAEILRRERAIIEQQTSLIGIETGLPLPSRFVGWYRRDPPRFPTYRRPGSD